MSTLVMKFGGTSVGSADAIRQVLSIVQDAKTHWQNVVVVTSAIRGVTDTLVGLVDAAQSADQPAVDGQVELLRQRHQQAVREFVDPDQHPALIESVDAQTDMLLDFLKTQLQGILAAGVADSRARDAVLSMGERLMARILAAIFQVHEIPSAPIDASEMIVTNTRFQNAQPLDEPSRTNAQRMIKPLLADGLVPVVTGYIGATENGDVTTFGRGGSDYSGTYLASLLDADEVWIWTDVDGVMSADPRQIKEARVLKTISYEEVAEFAHFGAKVLHPRSVEPLLAPAIPLRVCNTFNPSHLGTRITTQDDSQPRYLRAVTSISGVLVFIPNGGNPHGETMFQTVQQTLAQAFSQEAKPIITVDSHSGHLMCYVVPTTAPRNALTNCINQLQADFTENYVQLNWRVEPVAIVAAIGVVDVQQTVQVLNALKAVKADLLALGHGSPECSLLVVPSPQALRVMRHLHRMIDAVQMQLFYAENDPAGSPANLPASRRRQSKKQRGRTEPPQRVIPL